VRRGGARDLAGRQRRVLRWIRASRTVVAADLLLVMGRGRSKGPREGAGADSRQEVQRFQARFLCALSFSRVRLRTISRRLGGAGRAGFISRVRTVSLELRQPQRMTRPMGGILPGLKRRIAWVVQVCSASEPMPMQENAPSEMNEENAPSGMNVRIGGEALGRGGHDSNGGGGPRRSRREEHAIATRAGRPGCAACPLGSPCPGQVAEDIAAHVPSSSARNRRSAGQAPRRRSDRSRFSVAPRTGLDSIRDFETQTLLQPRCMNFYRQSVTTVVSKLLGWPKKEDLWSIWFKNSSSATALGNSPARRTAAAALRGSTSSHAPRDVHMYKVSLATGPIVHCEAIAQLCTPFLNVFLSGASAPLHRKQTPKNSFGWALFHIAAQCSI
jgi:hypothetical protein